MHSLDGCCRTPTQVFARAEHAYMVLSMCQQDHLHKQAGLDVQARRF